MPKINFILFAEILKALFLYYVYGVSVPFLHRESTNALILMLLYMYLCH